MILFSTLTPAVILLLFYIIVFTIVSLFFIPSMIVRAITLVYGILGIAFALVVVLSILGNPRPMDWGLLEPKEYFLISRRIKEKEEIYLWLYEKETKKPIYFSFPWSEDIANKLNEARTQSLIEGGQVAITPSINPSRSAIDLTIKHLPLVEIPK